jgi:hypothetical protein
VREAGRDNTGPDYKLLLWSNKVHGESRLPPGKGGIAVASILGENSAPCPYRKGSKQATGVEKPVVPMNFDAAEDCLGAYQWRRWHFFIAGKKWRTPPAPRWS